MFARKTLGIVLVCASAMLAIPGCDAGSGDPETDAIEIAGLEVSSADSDGVPTFANGNFGRIELSGKERTVEAERAALLPLLAALGPVFQVSPDDLVFERAFTDNIGDRHFVLAQQKNGLPVLGAKLVLHSRNDVVYAVHGSARNDLVPQGSARIDATEAIRLAKEDSPHVGELAAGDLPTMAYRPESGELHLVYVVKVTGVQEDGAPVDDDVLVSAENGSIVERLAHVHSAKNREVHDAQNSTSLPGALVRSEGDAATADSVVNTNYNLLGKTYQCYYQLFGRDSYNDLGATLVSSVHYSSNLNNAYWTGSQMLYGDGDGTVFSNLATAMDVTAHELTHAVTASSSALAYQNESGALNESISDIFGAVCEWFRDGQVVTSGTWVIGEDVYTPGTSGDGLRYMKNPTLDGVSTDYYPERLVLAQGTSPSTSNDYGWVHYNSGISNLAFFLLSKGGTHPRGKTATVVSGIGIDKASQIFYRANTVTLLGKPNATFAEMKTATEQAATQLGYSTAQIASVTAAWQAVGVGM